MKNRVKACTVLVMSSNYPRFFGDICGWFIHKISRGIAQKKYQVISLSPHTQNSKVREDMDGIDVNRFIYFFPERFEKLAYGSGILYNLRNSPIVFFTIIPFVLSELFWALKIIQKHQVKIIHTHWLIPQGLIGAIIHYLTRVPHIATIHGSDLNLIKNNIILKIVCRFIVTNSDAITTNSSYMKQQLLSITPDSLQKIQVIPMGVDPQKYQNCDIINLKLKYEASNIVLSVGRLIDWKGTIHLINAMPLVVKRFPDTRLLIVGTGPEKENLVQRTHQLSLEENVKFLGIVSDDDLVKYYHIADVFVLPSVNKSGETEGLGVVLLEAMASGCPVIGSNVGGIPDIITDGENGFLVHERDPAQLAEKIISLLLDVELRGTFRKNGYAKIEKSFSWERISDQFASVYHQVLTRMQE